MSFLALNIDITAELVFIPRLIMRGYRRIGRPQWRQSTLLRILAFEAPSKGLCADGVPVGSEASLRDGCNVAAPNSFLLKESVFDNVIWVKGQEKVEGRNFRTLEWLGFRQKNSPIAPGTPYRAEKRRGWPWPPGWF